MTALFNRAYTLRLGGLELSGLDIAFKIQRTLRPEPNRAEIIVWNLNEEHRKQLDGQKDRVGRRSDPIHVELEAGYADAQHLIFVGDLTVTYSERDGADIATHIAAGDGSLSWRSARVNFSVQPGTSVKDVLIKTGKAFISGKGNVSDSLNQLSNVIKIESQGNTFPEGTTISGSAVEEFQRLCDSAGLEWSIQNGIIQVKQKGKPLKQSAIDLTPETGLIGSPSVETSPPDPNKKKKQEKVVKCEALMIPGMVPGRKVHLKSESFDGTYEIWEVVYEGDTRGEKWGADLKLRPVS